MNVDFVFNSGSVTGGHPDKLCDRISDAIVDSFLIQDPKARVVAECAVSGGVLFVALRSNADASVDVADVARGVVAETGYRSGEFNADDCSVMISQSSLSAEDLPRLGIHDLDDEALAQLKSSHQVTLFGYACRQAGNLMPLSIELAHRLVRELSSAAADLNYLMPDGQAQVGIAYQGRKPVAVHSVTLIASQRKSAEPTLAQLRSDLMERVVVPALTQAGHPPNGRTQLVINPAGTVVGGGPLLHSGLTGRKTGIDTYGEYARHSEAALSGKDPLRIDRIGAYAARHAAKTVVASGLAEECELQLSYAVGQAEPISLRVHTYGTGRIEDGEIANRIRRTFDFRPGPIVRDYRLQLLAGERGGFFQALAAYGQVGREDLDVPWERLDRVEDLMD